MLSSQSRALPHRPGDCIPPPAPLLPLQPWARDSGLKSLQKGFFTGAHSFIPSQPLLPSQGSSPSLPARGNLLESIGALGPGDFTGKENIILASSFFLEAGGS